MAVETKPARSLKQLLDAHAIVPRTRMLSARDKEQLAIDRTRFSILSIAQGSDREDRHFWEFSVDIDGHPATFRLSCKPQIDGFYESLAFAVVDGPISDCVLVEVSRTQDNPFLVIEAA